MWVTDPNAMRTYVRSRSTRVNLVGESPRFDGMTLSRGMTRSLWFSGRCFGRGTCSGRGARGTGEIGRRTAVLEHESHL